MVSAPPLFTFFSALQRGDRLREPFGLGLLELRRQRLDILRHQLLQAFHRLHTQTLQVLLHRLDAASISAAGAAAAAAADR